MQRRRLTAVLELPKILSGIRSCQVTHCQSPSPIRSSQMIYLQFSACTTGLLHQLVCLLPLPIAPPLRFAVGSAPALSSQPGARGSAAAGPASTSSLHCTQSGSVPHVECQQTMSKHSRGDGRSATAAVSPDFVALPSTQANLTAVGASGADAPMPAAPQGSPPGKAQAALPGCPSPTREVQVRAAFLHEFRKMRPPRSKKTCGRRTRRIQSTPSDIAFVKIVDTFGF